jgi:hypothetical protein
METRGKVKTYRLITIYRHVPINWLLGSRNSGPEINEENSKLAPIKAIILSFEVAKNALVYL